MGFLFDFFYFIGALVVGGFTLGLAAFAGAWISGFEAILLSNAFAGKEKGVGKSAAIGCALFVLWALYCLFTAASVGAALVSVIGLIAVAAVILVVSFILFAI